MDVPGGGLMERALHFYSPHCAAAFYHGALLRTTRARGCARSAENFASKQCRGYVRLQQSTSLKVRR
jgi:hypothetical protein